MQKGGRNTLLDWFRLVYRKRVMEFLLSKASGWVEFKNLNAHHVAVSSLHTVIYSKQPMKLLPCTAGWLTASKPVTLPGVIHGSAQRGKSNQISRM